MKVLFDTNLILDVVFRRQPFVIDSGRLWQAHLENKIDGYVTASSVTDIFYVSRRLTDVVRAREAVETTLDTLNVATVDEAILRYANQLAGKDFEDNVQIACAVANGLDGIVTRDRLGFRRSPIRAYAPDELLDLIREETNE